MHESVRLVVSRAVSVWLCLLCGSAWPVSYTHLDVYKRKGEYIDGVLTRLTGAGALYLVLVCLLPEVMRTKLGTSFYFGGTSLLIVVVVVMDFIAQIQAHLMSHQYESLLKKANLKGRGAR